MQPHPALLLASLTISVPQPKHPVDQAHLVGDVADPVQRDVVAAPGEHAVRVISRRLVNV